MFLKDSCSSLRARCPITCHLCCRHGGLHITHLFPILQSCHLSFDDHTMNIHKKHTRRGRLAIQSPLAGYEPNRTVEISSTETTPVNPASRRTSFAQQRIPVRTSLRSPCRRKWMMDNASDSMLHRCSRRGEKQVRSLQEFITLKEKILCQTHHTQARGNQLRTNTNDCRAET